MMYSKIIIPVLLFISTSICGQSDWKERLLDAVQHGQYPAADSMFKQVKEYLDPPNLEEKMYWYFDTEKYYPILAYLVNSNQLKATFEFYHTDYKMFFGKYFIEQVVKYKDSISYRKEIDMVDKGIRDIEEFSYCRYLWEGIVLYDDSITAEKLIDRSDTCYNTPDPFYHKKYKLMDVFYKHGFLKLDLDRYYCWIGLISNEDTTLVNYALARYYPDGLSDSALVDISLATFNKMNDNFRALDSDSTYEADMKYIRWLMEKKGFHKLDRQVLLPEHPKYLNYLISHKYINLFGLTENGESLLDVLFFKNVLNSYRMTSYFDLEAHADRSLSYDNNVINMQNAEILIDQGVRIEKKDMINKLSDDGFTILDLAIFYKASPKVIQYLKMEGAKTAKEIKAHKL